MNRRKRKQLGATAPEIRVGRPDADRVFEVTARHPDSGDKMGSAMLMAEPREGWVRMAIIKVEPRYQRAGVGTKLYEAAARAACDHFELPLASDSDQQRSASAEAFWKKQVAKGRARHVAHRLFGGHYVLSCPAPESLAGARRRRR